MKRKNFSSDSPWEEKVGYSRAVQCGDWLFISGTSAVLNGDVQSPEDPYGQALFILNKIKNQLESAGFQLHDVVRTRMYVTSIDQWEEITQAHAEFFSSIKPATTLVEVSRLINPDLLVEIEVDAMRSTQY